MCYDDGTKEVSLTDYQEMRDFLLNADTLIGHNVKRFDIPVLERILGIKVTAQVIDTLVLSWYLYFTRKNHKLEMWGEDFGIQKPYISDWKNLPISVYVERCTEDVKITKKLWNVQYNKLRTLYDTEDEISRIIHYLSFKMDCAYKQERDRWKLDLDFCSEALQRLSKEKEEKTKELILVMPKVPEIIKKTRPKRMYNRRGELTKIGADWIKLLESQGKPFDTEETEIIKSYQEGNPNSPDQVKEWLYSLGWEPETFKTNKKKEEVPQVNQEFGKGICPSIKRLYVKEPNLHLLDGLSVLSHRIGILNGFLSSVDNEGFLQAQVAGLTNTLRFKHTTIVNLPKTEKPYGKEMRGCLVARQGYVICNADMSSLEDRLKQHFIYPYDPEYVKEMSKPDFDPHLDLAVLGGEITLEDSDGYKKGEKKVKPIRDIFKNVNYACQYLAGPPRLAKTGNIPLQKAQELHKLYWDRNHSIKTVTDTIRTKKVKDETWLYNPVSGFWYFLKDYKDRFSTLIQGTASYVFDLWLSYVLSERDQLTSQFHDEFNLEIKEGFEDKCTELLTKAINKLNDRLKLNRRLDIGIQYGNRYSECH